MDTELIFYLIFLAIALLSRFLKKKPEQPPSQGSTDAPRRQPVKSFDELLEEFTRQDSPEKTIRQESAPRATQRQKAEPASRKEEEYSLDTNFSFERQDKLKTLNELVDIENTRTTSFLKSADEKTSVEAEELSEIVEMLQEPENARKAFVLSEIFTRKYP